MWDINNMEASYITPVSVNESLVMLEQRAKWMRSVNMGQEEMIREVTVVHKGREGSPIALQAAYYCIISCLEKGVATSCPYEGVC